MSLAGRPRRRGPLCPPSAVADSVRAAVAALRQHGLPSPDADLLAFEDKLVVGRSAQRSRDHARFLELAASSRSDADSYFCVLLKPWEPLQLALWDEDSGDALQAVAAETLF